MALHASVLESGIQDLLPELERLYTDIHAHPELSMQETRTAGLAAERLRTAGFEVTAGMGRVPAGRRNRKGRRAMVDAGLLDRFPKPDVILGQHVMVTGVAAMIVASQAWLSA